MIYLTLTILSLYIFDPFKRLNGGAYGWLRRRFGYEVIVFYQPIETFRYVKPKPTPSAYTKPEESLLERTKIHFESQDYTGTYEDGKKVRYL